MLGFPGGVVDPLREAGRARYLKRAIDQIGQVVPRVGENCPVILAVDRYQRNVGVLPVGDRSALLGALALGIDREIENDLSRVEWTRRPSYGPVRSRLVEELPQSAIALVTAEDKDVRCAPCRPIKRLVAEQIKSLPFVQLVEPAPLTEADLRRVHTQAYIDAVKTGQPFRFFWRRCSQLREVKSAAVIVLLDRVGDAFERRRRMIEFARDLNFQFGMTHDGVIVDRDPAIGRDELPAFCQHQRIDFQ